MAPRRTGLAAAPAPAPAARCSICTFRIDHKSPSPRSFVNSGKVIIRFSPVASGGLQPSARGPQVHPRLRVPTSRAPTPTGARACRTHTGQCCGGARPHAVVRVEGGNRRAAARRRRAPRVPAAVRRADRAIPWGAADHRGAGAQSPDGCASAHLASMAGLLLACFRSAPTGGSTAHGPQRRSCDGQCLVPMTIPRRGPWWPASE